jgi:polysaccharide pyruvyl transferase WcaK-like protein
MTVRASIYLVALTGLPNYGDELVGATWLRHLAAEYPDADVWLDCHSPGPAQLLLGDLHPRVRFVDTLWRLHDIAPGGEDPWQVSHWVERAVNDPGQAPRWVAGIELLRSVDVIHVVGGGYLNSVWPRQIALAAGAAAAAGHSDAKLAMTGHGLLPTMAGADNLVHAILDRFDVVDVRDEPSGEYLTGLGTEVSVSCDDVFLDIEHAVANYSEEHPRYMLCVQSDLMDSTPSELAERVLGLLRAWGIDDEPIGVVEGIPRVDREIFELIEHSLPQARFYPFWDTWRDGMPVHADQVWISTRFHLHLVAAAAGASGVALSVRADYYDIKHTGLISRGSHWVLDDGAGKIPMPDGGGYSAAALDELAQRKRHVADRIYRHLNDVPADVGPPAPVVELPQGAPSERRQRWRRGKSARD